MVVLNSSQEKSIEIEKTMPHISYLELSKIQIQIRNSEEPPSGKAINIFVACENIRIKRFGG
jgi:hypothetical protein